MENNSTITHLYYSNELEGLLDYCDIDVDYDNRNKIEDIDSFIRYMKSRNLWNDSLQNETEMYMKFYNE